MKIKYYLNGAMKKTEITNEDLEITSSFIDHHFIAKVKVKNEVTFYNARHQLKFHVNFKDLYFLNGYQSWTDTKEFKLAKRLRNIKKSPHIITHMFGLDKYGDSKFYRYSIRKSHGYDVFYSKGKYESFIYNVNGKTAYLLIELMKDQRNIHLTSDIYGKNCKPGEEVVIFDFYFYENFEEGLASFNAYYEEIKNTPKVFGYTSWYNYYQNINEEIILRDLDALDSRFNVFQIDDGYETYVGDWLNIDKAKFPNGLEPIIDKIHNKGYKAGIWLAPFVAETNSQIFKEHFDWIKKDESGKPVLAGGNWSKFYALDLENNEVLDYIHKFLNYYIDLGFDFFKLDFLYASGIVPFNGKTRCETQEYAYSLLRNILKDKLILGCGAHILNSYQKFDYLRVGPDVSLVFDDVAFMRVFHRERISTKITLQNTIYRSIFNKHLFYNDPDVFLLRDNNIKLSFNQRVALTKINALFSGLLMTSDDIKDYDEKKNEVLEEAFELFYKAKVLSYETIGKYVRIVYELNGEKKEIKYNTKKGVII